MPIYVHQLTLPRPEFLGGGEWHLERLNEITVLFGKNGSGKSVALREMLKQAPESRHLAIAERPGDIIANAGLLEQEASGNSRATYRQQNTLNDYRNRAFARLHVLLQVRGLTLRPGSSDDTVVEIQQLLRELLPDFTLELVNEPPYFRLTRDDGSVVANAAAISSGEVAMVSLAVDLLTVCGIWRLEGRSNSILLVDEPDTHLHPDLQEYLAAFLLRLVDEFRVQLIVATHSTTLLAALGFHGGERTSALYLNRSNLPQPAIKFTDHLQEVAACLGGHALMGPLFGAPLLLVEGDDDYRIWSQVPRHHLIRLAVLPCNGEEIFKYQRSLEQIFESLRTSASQPAGYALVDADKAIPSHDTTPQRHVPFLKLCCHESENLYLSDEVLAAMSLDWPRAITLIQQRASEFGSKSGRLAGCDNWDRLTVNLKGLMQELEVILDPKTVPWTKRVGTVAGRAKPSGQLASFLGDSVIAALWG